MIEENINEIEAGRKLDCLVAHHVCGWRDLYEKDSGWDIHLRINRYGQGIELYGENYKRPEVDCLAESLPLAICHAALKVCGTLGQKKGA